MARRRIQPPEDMGIEEGGTFGFLRALWELNHALESASRAMKNRFGVTGPERLFVRVVGMRPGITPREIARTLRLHPSSITAVIKRMEARRLVARGVNPSDARSFHLYLTPGGQRVDTLTEGTIEAGVREAIAASDPDDVATASGLLVTIAQHLSSSMQRAPAPSRRHVRTRRRSVRPPHARE
jgi:MarR family transcriptional regulator, organic hydroperoxide resistance regulator